MGNTEDWRAGAPEGAGLYWNPGAISYAVELLLVAVLTVYLAGRVAAEARRGRVNGPTLLMAILIACLLPAFFGSLLRVMTAGGWVSYAMPWSPLNGWATLAMPWARPFAGMTAASFVAFAYRFPDRLPGARREARATVFLLALLVAAEFGIAARASLAISRSEVWWRPDWMAGWMSLAMLWAGAVFWRQFSAAQAGSLIVGKPSWPRRVWSGLVEVTRPAANRQATVARGFVLLTLLPITYASALFLPNEGRLGPYPLDVFICWMVLAQLVGLTLLLVGYLPERTSFLFKLTAICLALVLGAVNAAAWMIQPAYAADFRPPGLPRSGEALSFTPRDAGYVAGQAAFAPEAAQGARVPQAGLRVALPFALPFYGRTYGAAYVDARGAVALHRVLTPADAAFGAGRQPAIYPLLVDVAKAGGEVRAYAASDRLVVTRTDRCTSPTEACYRVQTILRRDGRIEMHFAQVPPAPEFGLFDPLHGPWMLGVTPGSRPSGKAMGQPVLRDFYQAYLVYLDRLFAPLVILAIGATLALLAGLPLLFRAFLVGPLNHLLDGLRRFRGGALETQVAVSFADEIGYLTDSFNEMARAQRAAMLDLEERVADRVAEVGEMTVRNAQLEERNRLSADLHDAVAQTMASASLLSAALPARLREAGGDGLETAERIALLNRHALLEMEGLLRELRSVEDGDRTLADRLADLAHLAARLHDVEIVCEISGGGALPVDVRTMIFRIAQECLNNIVKHSGARRGGLTFEALDDRALLVVSDDGRGFDLEHLAGSKRLGLTIMRERARRVGAQLEIDARPGEGCRVTLIWIRDRGA